MNEEENPLQDSQASKESEEKSTSASSNYDAGIDINQTVSLLKGGLLEPAKTWENYLGAMPSWIKTAFLLAGPLIVLNAVLSPVLSKLVGKLSSKLGPSLPVSIILGLIGGSIGLALFSFIFNFFSKVFKGNDNWAQSFAAVSLAAIPGYAGMIVGSVIPWLGGLISLAGGILSLVFLYQIQAKALNVPEDKRPLHYIASLLIALVVSFVLFGLIGGSMFKSSASRNFDNAFGSSSSSDMGMSRKDEKLLNAAKNDVYEPPKDGEVSKSQVKTLLSNLQKTQKIRSRIAADLEKRAKALDRKSDSGDIGLSDLGGMMRGVEDAAALMNAESLTVKRSGDNYAEHQWVKQTLREARYKRDTDKTAESNFKLYMEFEEKLEPLLNEIF